MRDFYLIKPKYSNITQGSIITGCVADGFDNSPVWGCIITARCDLENKKVERVHYLPIVSFEDWIKTFLVYRIRLGWGNSIKSSLRTRLKNKNISPDFLDRHLPENDFRQLIVSTFKEKEAKDFFREYDSWKSSESIEIKDILSTRNGIGLLKQEIDKVVSHDSSAEYLLEGWHSDSFSDYKILLLRDIKSITLECALKLADGVMETDLQDAFFTNNSLARTNNLDGFYYIDCEIKSPFIEHIIQRFTSNFARIGVVDLPKSVVSQQLVDYSKTVLL